MGKNLKEKLRENKALTFGELSVGDKYISLPIPGDNEGHGGLRGVHYIFQKIERVPNKENFDNAIRLNNGTLNYNPDRMRVIKVG